MSQDFRTRERAVATASGPYDFRPVVPADLGMLEAWLNEAHVRRWWHDPAKELAQIAQVLETHEFDAYVVAFGGAPIGYIQVYDPHSVWAAGGHLADQPRATRGIDQFIGEVGMLGIGHGPRFIDAMCVRLFRSGAPRVITDPEPANTRAIRAYEKAGFRKLDERTSPDGSVVLMARDRAN